MPIEPPATGASFPDVTDFEVDAVIRGGNLQPGTILAAYRQGFFPMPLDGADDLGWWSPADRGILPIDGLRVTRSMRASARRFRVTTDQAFGDVIDGCAEPDRTGGWISHDLREAYCELHALGWAHSVEVWRDDELAGGLYGVAVGGLFAGESMFYRERDASKVALMTLVELLDDGRPDRLLDTQWSTGHLSSLGVIEISRHEYLERLEVSLELPLPALWA